MQFIILTFFYIVLSGLSLKTNPKFCINCKFAINNIDKYNILGDEELQFIKCYLFPINKELNDSNFLVTGVNSISEPDYNYCSTSRKFTHMCGKEGKMYKKKYVRKEKS